MSWNNWNLTSYPSPLGLTPLDENRRDLNEQDSIWTRLSSVSR
jgi:hypothetical protein